MVKKFQVRIMAGLSLALVLFIANSLALGQTEAPDSAALYKKKCSMCHGQDGKGFSAMKTPDFTSADWQSARSDEEITDVVKSGKKGTPMPAFGTKLSEDEIKAVVAHVRTFGKK